MEKSDYIYIHPKHPKQLIPNQNIKKKKYIKPLKLTNILLNI